MDPPSPKPSITITEATAADIPALLATWRLSFNTPLFTGAIPASAPADLFLQRSYEILLAPRPPGAGIDTRVAVVRDGGHAHGTPVSVAVYQVVRPGQDAGDWRTNWRDRWADYEGAEVAGGEGGLSKEGVEGFFGYMGTEHRFVMGARRHVFLEILQTREGHRRRGYGSALVRWGTQMADRLGYECFVDATPAGFGVYERCGYVKQDASAAFPEGKVSESLVPMLRPKQ